MALLDVISTGPVSRSGGTAVVHIGPVLHFLIESIPTSIMTTAIHVRLSTSISSLPALLGGLALALTLGVAGPSPAQAQNTFTVNSTADAPDTNTGDGTCDTGNTVNGNPECTLRAAIQEANKTANNNGPDRIFFDIPGTASPSSPHVIQPGNSTGNPLPDITDPVLIDGTKEPDYNAGNVSDPKPVVELDGNGSSTSGIVFDADGNTVRGLAIVGFSGGNGIEALNGRTDQTIFGCHVGVRADGTTIAGNATGIYIRSNSKIGGTGPDEHNIIGGNSGAGIFLTGANVTVQGNYIGTNPNDDKLGNGTDGVLTIVRNNTIGGTGTGAANVIAFNDAAGVAIAGSGIIGNTVRANQIFDNGSLGIDLANDGRTSNDAGDGDDGTNELQNFPEIQSADYNPGRTIPTVTVTYLVPSDPNSGGSGPSTYPLKVDFYKADADAEEGKAYLGTDEYDQSDYGSGCSTPPCTVTPTFRPEGSVSQPDKIVATATDANGNTSEFSPASSKLPVELASFEAAQVENRAVQLTWTTASETNNAGFRVQHREARAPGAHRRVTASKQEQGDAGTWNQMGRVDGAGTTTEVQSYRFKVEGLSVGTHEFRLKQVDLDGTTTVHDPVTVEVQMQEALRLSAPAPNPVQVRATLSFAVKDRTEATLTLYNTLGQRVRTVYLGTPPAGEAQTVRLSTTDLTSGVYFVRLQAGAQTKTRRVTVVR